MEKLLLTVEETMESLSLSRSKIYQLIFHDGDDCLPSIKVGASRRIPVKGLQEWVQRQAEQQQPEPANIVSLSKKRA